MASLKIYKASAGSGKTYKLTEEYLRLLFKNHSFYRNILAVTFTNKATEEMKKRIVGELNRLAEGEQTGYAEVLKKEYSLNNEQLQFKANQILGKILHDYSHFSISTIDSFFQQILRSFTKEVGLQAGFSIELDQQKPLDYAISELIREIDSDQLLRKWLIAFADEIIGSGKSLNLRKEIHSLGQELFKEAFNFIDKDLAIKLSDKNFLADYTKELINIEKSVVDKMKLISEKAMQIMQSHSLEVADFAGKSKSFVSFFAKIKRNPGIEFTKTAKEAFDDVNKWFAKTSDRKNDIIAAYNAGLNALLGEALEISVNEAILYKSAKRVRANLYQLGILIDLQKHLRKYIADENTFLISDTPKFLNQIIANNDAPFIYEKAGNVFKFFMIDEFQDTSDLQWQNFLPLLNNSLSEDNLNLLVGDVKQAIYRWRNSNWKLLAEQVDIDFGHVDLEKIVLEYNWRSKKQVVDFNNQFFQFSSNQLQQHLVGEISGKELLDELSELETKISGAYSDLFQKVTDSESRVGGYVKHQFLKDENKDAVLLELPKLIEQLQENNYELKDIAILVRGAKDGIKVANTLLEYKNSNEAKAGFRYDVISNESLYLKNASAIRILILCFRTIVDKKDFLSIAQLIHEYNQTQSLDYFYSFIDRIDNEMLIRYLPIEFVQNIDNFKQLSLFELTEQLVLIFKLNNQPESLPYLQAFQDLIMSYSTDRVSDLILFVDWWDSEGVKKAISVSEDQNAIKILTIHKSKGLEFKAVIIPYCNWTLDHKKNPIIWCKPAIAPFNKIALLPVKYESKMADTIFYNDYYQEKCQAYVDNLNLIYVAFTRAKEALFTFSNCKKKASFSDVSDLVFDFAQQEKDQPNCTFNDTAESITFEVGQLNQTVNEDKKEAEEFKLMQYPVKVLDEQISVKYHSVDFFTNETLTTTSSVNFGTLMHDVFKEIKTEKDVEASLNKLLFSGSISQIELDNLKNNILDLLKNPDVKDWFSGNWEVKTESTILIDRSLSKRPDRVLIKGDKAIVIDYKFGDVESSTNIEQVKEYMDYLTQMGYQKVEGYLWYVKKNTIKPVLI